MLIAATILSLALLLCIREMKRLGNRNTILERQVDSLNQEKEELKKEIHSRTKDLANVLRSAKHGALDHPINKKGEHNENN